MKDKKLVIVRNTVGPKGDLFIDDELTIGKDISIEAAQELIGAKRGKIKDETAKKKAKPAKGEEK